MKKEIWLPSSETKVTVDSEGKMYVWEEMVMTLKPLNQSSGFGEKKMT